MDESGVIGVSVLLDVSPIVGKFLDMIPRAAQACLDRNVLLVESLKYTNCLVDRIAPDGEVPVILSGSAPMMFIPLLFAAFIFILTGISCERSILSLGSRSTEALMSPGEVATQQ